ncbi:MAG: YihY/virulence factor BrkB family protein [Actinobacteria bacterium]|nr:YihY/virulence factor BrkB family protein [Actinomycetota bacterium]
MDLIRHLVKDAFARFFRNGGFFLAAAVAFFASISVFPLLLLGFVVLLLFVRTGAAESTILEIANGILPNGAGFLKQLIEGRVGATNAGIVGAIALIYAGMAVFGALQYALDRSFETKIQRTYGRFLLTSLIMALVSGGAIVLVALFRIAVGMAEKMADPVSSTLVTLLSFLSETMIFIGFFVVITLTYTFIPIDRFSFRQVWPGAVFGAVSVYIAQVIFSISLKRTTIPFIFGSLTAIIALLIWLDITAILIILGAELAAAWMSLPETKERRR